MYGTFNYIQKLGLTFLVSNHKLNTLVFPFLFPEGTCAHWWKRRNPTMGCGHAAILFQTPFLLSVRIWGTHDMCPACFSICWGHDLNMSAMWSSAPLTIIGWPWSFSFTKEDKTPAEQSQSHLTHSIYLCSLISWISWFPRVSCSYLSGPQGAS